jgi:hypothetical protein
MRRSSWTPSIVPKEHDENVYLVTDDFKRDGQVSAARMLETGSSAAGALTTRARS